MLSTETQFKIEKVSASRINQVNYETLKFGHEFSDHMFVADYRDGQWSKGEIKPFQKLTMSPATSAIHYGQSIFEGLKAYRGITDDILIFRPDENFKRFNTSAERMCMPQVPEELFLQGLYALVDLDKEWVPGLEGASLYLRPFMFATDEFIGVAPSESYRFIIFTSPVKSYYAEPLNVKVETKFTRAAQGGVGAAKTAGNYAASLYPAALARKQGYHQLIWTDHKEHKYIEESGTMNIMFVIDGVLLTPPTGDTILAGITRKSVIEIAKYWELDFEERRISVEEIERAIEAGKLQEAFGVGTAATIAQIKTITIGEQKYELPEISTRKVSAKISKFLNEIKTGEAIDPFNWIVKI
ncbi:MAG: branched-chain amino acid aminotransferase [Luteibaculaceae bacterium]